MLFRLTFASYLVEGICDVALAVFFYVLLKPVNRNLALLAMRIAAMIAWLFLCMYGIASMIRGYLIARSGYLPRLIGILFVIGGAGFFLRSITYLVAPSLSSPLLLLPMAVAGLPLMAWLLWRGIDGRAAPSAG